MRKIEVWDNLPKERNLSFIIRTLTVGQGFSPCRLAAGNRYEFTDLRQISALTVGMELHQSPKINLICINIILFKCRGGYPPRHYFIYKLYKFINYLDCLREISQFKAHRNKQGEYVVTYVEPLVRSNAEVRNLSITIKRESRKQRRNLRFYHPHG